MSKSSLGGGYPPQPPTILSWLGGAIGLLVAILFWPIVMRITGPTFRNYADEQYGLGAGDFLGPVFGVIVFIAIASLLHVLTKVAVARLAALFG
jgi:hypothetical protein